MSPGPALLGAVLAGGRGRRFGSDKARALLGGTTLVERAARTLSSLVAPVVVSRAEPERLRLEADPTAHHAPSWHVRRGDPEWAVVPDLREGCGPLGALEAVLTHARTLGLEGVLVLACDLPLVEVDTVRAVIGCLGDRPAAAAAAPEPLGVQPLCAVWRTTCLGDVSAVLDAGERSVRRCYATVGGVTLEVPGEQLLNVNTTQDLARVEAVLRARSGTAG